jgi:hypothetical protein
MAAKSHTHKYRLINIGSKEKPRKVYACSLPDCSHHIPTHQRKTIIGKESICWECDKKMIMSRDIVRKNVVKPRCWHCRGIDNPSISKKFIPQEEIKSTDAAIEMLLKMRLGK